MVKSKKIPKEDLKDINDSFKMSPSGGEETISKDGAGQIITLSKKIVDVRGHELQDFRGRILKHNVSHIPVGGRQTLIAKKGMLFDDIPEVDRNKITWMESYFV